MTVHKLAMDKFTRVERDYMAIIHNPNPLIPPIFGADEFGWCSEWNAAMTKLTGWHRDEMLDKMLLGEVFDSSNASCRLKNKNAFVGLCILVNSALAGEGSEKAPFGFFDRSGKYIECLLSVNRKENEDGLITGVFCFIHVASLELQHTLQVQKASEQKSLKRLKAFSYMRHAITNPLSGMLYSRKALKNTGLNEEQMKQIHVADNCHHQLNKILVDLDQDSITEKCSCLDLEMAEFVLQDVLMAAVSQVLLACQGKGITVSCNMPEIFLKQLVYGDGVRLQQILSDVLFVSVKFSPVGGSVGISSKLTKKSIRGNLHLIDLEIRIKHQGLGVPAELMSEMFEEDSKEKSEEGLALLVSRNLLSLMNGDVRHLREADVSTFILTFELAMGQ